MTRPVLCLLTLLLAAPLAAQDSLSARPADVPAATYQRMLSVHLKRLADDVFEQNRKAYEAIDSPEAMQAYQRGLHQFFLRQLSLPAERTPLNAKVVGTVQAEGYHVEKVLFESQPRHYVTANLYLPAGQGPFPGVVVPCGHSANGKVAQQRICIALTSHGIAAISYDPIGQGERYQLLTAEGKPMFGSTTEHTRLGVGSMLVGRNTASYRVWDGMRTIDYLVSRPEIDARRIGCTGCSGGGTLTSYLMALDERIACAAPSCYVTSIERLFDTIGPQDAEQNIYGQLAGGMDHAGYLLMRAPRPTLILAASRDFFDIQGTWQSFRVAKRFYTRMGFAERVDLVETDTKHGYPQAQREAMVRWMRRWLAGVDEPVTEPEFATHKESELLCSPQGQVMRIAGAKSVVDLNRELDEQLAAGRAKFWKQTPREQAAAEIRRIAGIRPLSKLPRPQASVTGSIDRDGYKIDKLVLKLEEDLWLPSLLFVPQKANGTRTLLVDGDGKSAVVEAAEKLAKAGHVVLAVDLRGTGETGSSSGVWGGNFKGFFTSYLLGRPLLGMRAEDVLVAARWLSEWERPDKPQPVALRASGLAGPPALHAAFVESQQFAGVTIEKCVESWSLVVRTPVAEGQLINAVHGALRVYDLPDLRAALGKRLDFRDPLDAAGQPYSKPSNASKP